MTRLRAVTFDFWNTLFEPRAGALDQRAQAAAGFLDGLGFEIPPAAVAAALQEAGRLHTEAWRRGEQYGTPFLVREIDSRLGLGLDRVRRERFREVLEDPGLGPLEPVAGAVEAVARLAAAGLRLGIVSDTGWSPGRRLRGLLARSGMLCHFVGDALSFSDEVGVPKPHARIFWRSLDALRVEPGEAAHVGDLRFTDVAGARAIGMRAIRFSGVVDDPEEGPEADAVAVSHRDLVAILLQ